MDSAIQIVFEEDIQRVFDQFCACFEIRILYYSADGKILKTGLNNPDSPFCQLLQKKLYSEEKCLYLDQQKRNEAAAKRRMICYTCYAGLTEAIYPIFIYNNLAGFAVIGQFRHTDDIISCVQNDWSKKYATKELMSAYKKLPKYTIKKTKHILSLFSILVNYILSNDIREIKGNLLIARILTYLKNNLSKHNVSLEEIAEYLGVSVSTVSHVVKKELNVPLKQLYIELKMQKAEEYFRLSSNLRVSEVAEKLGYIDPFYFSRIYKIHRQISPSKYIKKTRRHRGHMPQNNNIEDFPIKTHFDPLISSVKMPVEFD